MSDAERIADALGVIGQYGQTDGGHHKAWVLDQATRLLLGCKLEIVTLTDSQGRPFEAEVVGSNAAYRDWVRDICAGEDGPETYEYVEGIAP